MSKGIYNYHGVQFGCDPELFLSTEVRKRKMIVGSEIVVPEGGHRLAYKNPSIVRDGAQVELHPQPESCRANQSNELSKIFTALQGLIDKTNKALGSDIKIDLTPVVKLTKGNLARLSADSRQLGCLPSENAYGRKHIQKDGTRYLVRAAGGHIHFGSAALQKNGAVNPLDFAKLCDLIIGNTCVLIDRSPHAALRRKVYGRAGEYRTPSHGFEYRTLSNFWLWNYKLFSLVMGLANSTFSIAQGKAGYEWITKCYPTYGYEKAYHADPMQWLFERADFTKIEKAINTNDFDLALETFDAVLVPFMQMTSTLAKGLSADKLDHFRDFYTKLREAELAGNPNPLTAWFPEDPVQHWINKGDGHGQGWETYASQWRTALALKKMSAVIQVPENKPAEQVPVPNPVKYDNFDHGIYVKIVETA